MLVRFVKHSFMDYTCYMQNYSMETVGRREKLA